jgi:hypothetical protein
VKRVSSAVLALALVFSVAVPVTAAHGVQPKKMCKTGGKGTDRDPYTICSVDDFEKIREQPGKSYELGADIDFPSAELNNYTPITQFTGTLDGRNHKISSLATYSGGLFLENYGKVVNLRVVDSNISSEYAGTIANVNYGTIRNVGVHGKVQGGNTGLIAGTNSGTIALSEASGTLIGTVVGGIAGTNGPNGLIEHSISSVQVSGFAQAGGLVGLNNGEIRSSLSTGDVSIYAGGAGGFAAANNPGGKIVNSLSLGKVNAATGAIDVGRFAGKNYGVIQSSIGLGPVVYS